MMNRPSARSRRAPRPALRACVVACLSFLAFPVAWAADDWTQEGQGAGAASFNGEQSVLGAGNVDQLVKLWARDLDVWGQSTNVVVSDGQAFIGRKIADEQTAFRQQLARLDLDTGKILWQVDLPEEIAVPALTPQLVISAGNIKGRKAQVTHVRAFDRATGASRWVYTHPHATTFLSPHVLDGGLYLVGYDGEAAALDAETGALRWRRQLPGSDCCSTHGSAVADGVMVVSRNVGIIALDAIDGHTLWRFDVQENHLANERPLIVNGIALLFDLDGLVHAFDLATGKVRWVTATHNNHETRAYGPMATDGQRVYAMTGVVKPAVTAIDLATGATLWMTHQRVWAHSPVVSNGVLYLGTDKHLVALDTATGADLPIAQLPSSRIGELTIAEGRLLMGGGPVRAYGLPTAR